MRKALVFLLVATLTAMPLAAQTSNPSTQPSTAPPGPSTMPPDQSAPPPGQPPGTALPPSTVNQDQQNEPVRGSRRASPADSERGRRIEPNTEIKATLDTPLSSKTSKPGDQFTATVAEAVRAADGTVGIPAGSKIHGEVTNVEEGKTLPSVRGKARLNMRFRDVSLTDGTTMPLTATLVSLNKTSGKADKAGARTNEEGEVTDRTTGREVAKDVGIGAGIGTVAGLIFGSALKGLVIGAIAGGGYVLATQGRDVNVPAETGMVLRVDRSMTVPGSGSR